MTLLLLFLRAFILVTLTAANIRQVSQGHYIGAFICGTLISLVWYLNVHTAAHDPSWYATAAYSFGAGCGTICGMRLTIRRRHGTQP